MRPKLVPMREILFAAKMGFVSRPLWEEYFARWSRAQNARNWNKLTGDGFFRAHDSKMLRNVLVLAPKAINELRNQGILAVTQPHLGQFDHDTKVARIVLGLEKENVLKGFTTEGELKKKFMVWMKTTHEGKSAKFPDLTLEFRGGGKFKTVAVEVEQSLKNFDRYKQVMTSYANAKEIEAVVFVSDQQTIFNRIARAMKETNYPSWERPVGFGEMNEWLKNPVTALIHLNRGVSSIREWTADAK
ncbi:MAG: hypothetical protein AB7H97_15100 [Pseudobdellovibrionaceae bacterium]